MTNIVERLRHPNLFECDLEYGLEVVGRAADEIITLRTQLGELLAIHHGDGGHYLAEHGPEKAVKDAIEKWSSVLVRKDVAEYDAKTLRAQLEKVVEGLEKMTSVNGDHMTACDKTMGDTHPCTCGADTARSTLAAIKGEAS